MIAVTVVSLCGGVTTLATAVVSNSWPSKPVGDVLADVLHQVGELPDRDVAQRLIES